MKTEMFELFSYRNWAIDELIRYIRKHGDIHPLDAIEDFRYQMDLYACKTTSNVLNFAFSVAVDVARDALDVLQEQYIT